MSALSRLDGQAGLLPKRPHRRACTFENHGDLTVCEMCDATRRPDDCVVVDAAVEDKAACCATDVATASSSSACVSSSSNPLTKLLNSVAGGHRISLYFPVFVPDHYTQLGGYGAEWSCGYRNIQMLCSALMQVPQYKEALFEGSGKMPSISELQQHIEAAWAVGFDAEGAAQLSHRLQGTNKWIGTTECAALLRYFRIRAVLVDFPVVGEPAAAGGGDVGCKRARTEQANPQNRKATKRADYVSHVAQRVGEWVRQYFAEGDQPLFPLYFQNQGHSTTIAGLASASSADLPELVVFDPATSTQQMLRALTEASRSGVGVKPSFAWKAQLLRPLHKLGNKSHQLLFVAPGLMVDDVEYQGAKVLSSMLA